MVCLTCQSETSNPKFCSRSCAATHNNKSFPKRAQSRPCKICYSTVPSSRTYCKSCWQNKNRIISQKENKIKDWENGIWRGGTDYGLSKIIRDYLLNKSNFSCDKCRFNTPHPNDGKTILEINHIDGNGLNHSPNNLEVLCPNCHALTSTYRGRNIGNGRPVSYVRIPSQRSL